MKRIISLAITAILVLCYFSEIVFASEYTYTGTFEIPSVSLSVPFTQESDSSLWQDIVDQRNLALLIKNLYGDTMILADHSNQSFRLLPSVSVGDKAHVVMSDGTEVYLECSEIISGTNIGKDIVTSDNRSVRGGHVGDLVCYTCARTLENPDGVLIVIFNECEMQEVSITDPTDETIETVQTVEPVEPVIDTEEISENITNDDVEYVDTVEVLTVEANESETTDVKTVDYTTIVEMIAEFLRKWFAGLV